MARLVSFRIAVSLLLLIAVSSCAQISGNSSHAKYNWKAEDYFRNDKVISLCNAIEANNIKEIERLIKEKKTKGDILLFQPLTTAHSHQ